MWAYDASEGAVLTVTVQRQERDPEGQVRKKEVEVFRNRLGDREAGIFRAARRGGPGGSE
jgi:hypothetical protein